MQNTTCSLQYLYSQQQPQKLDTVASPPLHRWENWSSQGWNGSLKTVQLVQERAENRLGFGLSPNPGCHHLICLPLLYLGSCIPVTLEPVGNGGIDQACVQSWTLPLAISSCHSHPQPPPWHPMGFIHCLFCISSSLCYSGILCNPWHKVNKFSWIKLSHRAFLQTCGRYMATKATPE